MPRYHFDLALGQARIRDAEGVDLPDEEAARWHALNEIRELLATSIGKRLAKNCLIKVRNSRGRTLFKVGCDEDPAS
jgi:hypothetical protein